MLIEPKPLEPQSSTPISNEHYHLKQQYNHMVTDYNTLVAYSLMTKKENKKLIAENDILFTELVQATGEDVIDLMVRMSGVQAEKEQSLKEVPKEDNQQ